MSDIDENNIIKSDILNKTVEKIKNACCQITFIINGSYYIGSGWFFYETNEDLKFGYLITAAHCVMEIIDNVYYKTSEFYFQNPITENWTKADVNNIFIDGIGDIALIKTNIDFTNYESYCLKLSQNEIIEGELCYVVGNPMGFDEDSFSLGTARDPHYCEPGGYQVPDSLHVSCPGMGGNSGGPIVDIKGDVIGIYTFGLAGGYECFGGGSNKDVLKKSLDIMKTNTDNKIKRYLGLDWSVPSPFLIKNYYQNDNSFSTNGVYIHSVSEKSPFYGILNAGDLLLNATIVNTNEIIEFGNKYNERTPGILIYNYSNIEINISYIKSGSINKISSLVTLNKTYNDVPNILDGPLQTGLRERQNCKFLQRIKLENV